jgi:hypothetical protein
MPKKCVQIFGNTVGAVVLEKERKPGSGTLLIAKIFS